MAHLSNKVKINLIKIIMKIVFIHEEGKHIFEKRDAIKKVCFWKIKVYFRKIISKDIGNLIVNKS